MTNKQKQIQEKAASMLDGRSTENLFELFDAIDGSDKNPEEKARVRGWIMDALERRNPAAFEAWMLSDSQEPKDFF